MTTNNSITKNSEYKLYGLPIPEPETNTYYIGIDEVARGCLAGPVVACAICLDYKKILSTIKSFADGNNATENGLMYPPKIADSKKLSSRQRIDAVHWIKEHTLSYAIEEASNNEIDELNIRNATFLAMSRALVKCISALPHKATKETLNNNEPTVKINVIIDGNAFELPDTFLEELDKPYISYWTQIKGDANNLSIACASIMAKEYRDAQIDELVKQNPELAYYDWANNRAYGTANHFKLISQHGISKWHRKSFLTKLM